MTDLTRFPEAVREKLADLDRRIEGAQSEERDHQRELSRLQIDLAQNLILRAAIVETAECVLQAWAPKLEDQVSGNSVAVTPAEPVEWGRDLAWPPEFITGRRPRRRDIRGEVLTILEDGKKLSVKGIADLINASESSVLKALAVHERNGKLIEGPAGLWSVVEPPQAHAQTGPIVVVETTEMVEDEA